MSKSRGLINLGNTCFMNSALQCLSAITSLTGFMLGDWIEDLNINNPLGSKGEIARVYAALMETLWLSLSTDAVAPSLFKTTIGLLNPVFLGYGQQDSHELLQSLLDGLHEDLNRIKVKAYTEDKEHHKDIDEGLLAKLSWESYVARNDSIVVDLFQALLMSRTKCMVCGTGSKKFDPYMYLQLPVPESEMTLVSIHVLPRYSASTNADRTANNSTDADTINEEEEDSSSRRYNSRTQKIQVKVKRHCTIGDLQEQTKLQMGWSGETICVELFQHKVYKEFLDSDSIDVIEYMDIILIAECGSGETIQCALKIDTEFTHFADPIFVSLAPEVMAADIYNTIIEGISRYSQVPLFRRIGSSATSSIVASWTADINNEDLRFDLDLPGFEAVPGIFTIEVKNGAKLILSIGQPSDDMDVIVDREIERALLHEEISQEDSAVDSIVGSVQEPPAEKLIRISSSTMFSVNFERNMAKAMFEISAEDQFNSKQTTDVNQNIEKSATKDVPRRLSLADCMTEFCKEETLDQNDSLYCSNCKEFQQTKKSLSVYSVPKILIIQLKRFSGSRYRTKITDLIDAPIEGLDMSDLIGTLELEKDEMIYDLIAVSNHFGGLGGGHSYTLHPLSNQWQNCDDSNVSPLEGAVITPAAYVLFYKQRSTSPSESFEARLNLARTKKDFEIGEERQKRRIEETLNKDRDNEARKNAYERANLRRLIKAEVKEEIIPDLNLSADDSPPPEYALADSNAFQGDQPITEWQNKLKK